MHSSYCPSCQIPTLVELLEISRDADANYYRCYECGHVWTVRKDDATVIFHVTVPIESGHPRMPWCFSGCSL